MVAAIASAPPPLRSFAALTVVSVPAISSAIRGSYDAVQLASALPWQDSIGQEVVLAAFDRQLWEATTRAGLAHSRDSVAFDESVD